MVVLSQYKFYLAFENFQIEDYVSEKVFEGLLSGAVPVYRGASRVDKVMPAKDCYVDANNMTPKELAEHLKLLGKDKKAYEKYLEFKNSNKDYISKNFLDAAFRSYVHPLVGCRLCDYHLRMSKQRKLMSNATEMLPL